MSEVRIASRYAKSLFFLAKEQGGIDAVYADIKSISEAISANHDLQVLLHSPVVKSAIKNKILLSVFESCTPLTVTFLSKVIEARREGFLPEITEQFVALYNIEKGIAVATVISSTPLDEANTELVRKYISGKINKPHVELTLKTDESIIGGVIINYEDKLLDMSIKSELYKLKQKLN
jgi:F-type H+-transporting ATPase subunit delta